MATMAASKEVMQSLKWRVSRLTEHFDTFEREPRVEPRPVKEGNRHSSVKQPQELVVKPAVGLGNKR